MKWLSRKLSKPEKQKWKKPTDLKQQELINENSWVTSWVPFLDKFLKLMDRGESMIHLGISKTSDTMSGDILLANSF